MISVDNTVLTLLNQFLPGLSLDTDTRITIAQSPSMDNATQSLYGSVKRHIIIVLPQSKAILCDNINADITEIIVGEHATLYYQVPLQNCSARHYALYSASYGTLYAQYEGRMIAGTYIIEAHLIHPHAQIIIGWATTTASSQNLAIHTKQIHAAPYTYSRLMLRKIVYEQGRCDYKGLISIAQTAPYSDAAQDDGTLLDGMQSHAEAMPAIEVLNNDVYCAHGSAIGQLDADMIWYCTTRGLSVAQAQRLCYDAFLQEACRVYTVEHKKG